MSLAHFQLQREGTGKETNESTAKIQQFCVALLSNHSLYPSFFGAPTHPYIPLHFEEMIFPLVSDIFSVYMWI